MTSETMNPKESLISFYKEYLSRKDSINSTGAFANYNVLSGALNLFYRAKNMPESILRDTRALMFNALKEDGYDLKTGLDTKEVDRNNRLFSKERVAWVTSQVARLS